GPVAVEGLLVQPLGHPALAADHPADPQQLTVTPLQDADHRVEALADLAVAAATPPDPDLEVAAFQPDQSLGELGERLFGVTARDLAGPTDRSHQGPPKVGRTHPAPNALSGRG